MTISAERATEILADLIAIPSVNPMGGSFNGRVPVERGVTAYVADVLADSGLEVARDQFSDMHENLVVSVAGRTDEGAVLFEAHADTVPAADWGDDAFHPRVEDGIVFGRGACDDKGALASMLLAMVDLTERGQVPPRGVVLLVAGDEEYAQTGIKRFRECEHKIDHAVFGEPTNLVPIVQHKGTVRWDIVTHGRSAHTSMPELGRNAVLDMLEIIRRLQAHEADLQERHRNLLTGPPSLTVTMISGGRTRNAVPDRCTIAVDLRVVPGMDPAEAREEVVDVLSRVDAEVSHGDVQLLTPPLNTAPDHPFVGTVVDICRGHAGMDIGCGGAPYGTDAAWISDRAPAVVLGPGSIDSAHAVGEHVPIEEVVRCALIYRDIMLAAD